MAKMVTLGNPTAHHWSSALKETNFIPYLPLKPVYDCIRVAMYILKVLVCTGTPEETFFVYFIQCTIIVKAAEPLGEPPDKRQFWEELTKDHLHSCIW